MFKLLHGKFFSLKAFGWNSSPVHLECITVYTRVQVERVYKSNPIFEAKNTTFLEKV